MLSWIDLSEKNRDGLAEKDTCLASSSGASLDSFPIILRKELT